MFLKTDLIKTNESNMIPFKKKLAKKRYHSKDLQKFLLTPKKVA